MAKVAPGPVRIRANVGSTSRVAALLVVAPVGSETTTEYSPAWEGTALVSVRTRLVAPAIGSSPNRHWNVIASSLVARTVKVTLSPRLTKRGMGCLVRVGPAWAEGGFMRSASVAKRMRAADLEVMRGRAFKE